MTELPTTRQLRPLAEAWLSKHYQSETKTPTGEDTLKFKLALQRWYGALAATEAFTGVDRRILGGTTERILLQHDGVVALGNAYVAALLDGSTNVRASEMWEVIAIAIRGNIAVAIERGEVFAS